MPKEHINPPELFNSLQYGFSQIVACTGGRTVYLSGQVAWNENEQIVDKENFARQTEQALRNVEAALQSTGGEITDVVSMRIYIVESRLGESHHVSEALRRTFPPAQAPATTWIGVTALANEDFLIEIEAIAVIDSSAG